MKIIITYISAGSGHLRAAEAIYNYFKEKNPRLELELVDVLSYSTGFFKFFYKSGYVFMVRYLSWLWAIGFSLTSTKFMRPLIKIIFFPITVFNNKDFIRFLKEESADVVISTHFLASEIVAYLKRGGKINARLVTVITDFGVHPFWMQDGTDLYIAASGFTQDRLTQKGVIPDKIRVLGIPVHAGFLNEGPRHTLCKKLQIEEDKFTVLLLTGSFGIGPIEKIVDLLHRDVQVLVVCARNKKLAARLKRKNYAQVKVFGFVDEIYDFMAVSDVVITKPGGLTVSELLVMGLAPIFISAIPGQETENVRALAHYGIGALLNNPRQVRQKVLDYKKDPAQLEIVRQNISLIRKPASVEDLYNVVC